MLLYLFWMVLWLKDSVRVQRLTNLPINARRKSFLRKKFSILNHMDSPFLHLASLDDSLLLAFLLVQMYLGIVLRQD
uniref:Alternative protein AP4E1 n=1 Tax=Homo sapiens TaxID=9606 RepID=L8ECD9_HUMAN|nr:alternative protein AP4E1 [Homo sapiens]